MRPQLSACCPLPGWWRQGAAVAEAGTEKRPDLQLQSNGCACNNLCGCCASCRLFERRSGMAMCTNWPDAASAAARVCGLAECRFGSCTAEAVSIVVTRLNCTAAATILPNCRVLCCGTPQAGTLLHPGSGSGGGGAGGGAARLTLWSAARHELASSQLPAAEVLQGIERLLNWPRHRRSVVGSASATDASLTSLGDPAERQASPWVKGAGTGYRTLVSR
jgi:hypothetical protein